MENLKLRKRERAAVGVGGWFVFCLILLTELELLRQSAGVN